MKVLITGAAGFIGSHLVEASLAAGHQVVGVDSFTDYYEPAIKRAHWDCFARHPRFIPVPHPIAHPAFEDALAGTDIVFHLAGQPGVRASFGPEFRWYLENNVEATHRLLTLAEAASVPRIVYASSSSVYGRIPLPAREDGPTRPYSPYGVTKHAAESLVRVAAENGRLDTVSLRFFTVYGPRQRPDMAFHRFIRSISTGQPVTVYGDGRQTRDFTFVDDVVRAMWRAADHGRCGGTYNIGGGHRMSLNDTLTAIAEAIGKPADIRYGDPMPGDVPDTGGDISRAETELGWKPRTHIADGIRAQVESMLVRR